MKKILIIGATGSLAQYVIEALKALDNIELTLFSRNVNRLSPKVTDGCQIIQGDATNINDVKRAVEGKDIVYINLAGNLEAMAKNIVKAMQETGQSRSGVPADAVKRVIAISSVGIYDTPMKPVLQPYRKLADVIEASGLDYTLLRPDWFTSANEVDYALTHKGEPESGTAISRKSIAAFVATLVESPQLHIKENLGISKPR